MPSRNRLNRASIHTLFWLMSHISMREKRRTLVAVYVGGGMCCTVVYVGLLRRVL